MLKLYGGKPFGLADHIDRLDRSAAGIFLEYDRPAFEREIAALIAEHGAARRGAATRAVARRPPDRDHRAAARLSSTG